MKTLRIMIGLPRSGKSTWIKQNKINEVVVSADELRYLVYNQRFWSNGESLMWSINKIILKMLMQQGVDIIVDETNTTIDRRKSIIKQAKEYDYIIDCICISTPKEICIERAISLNDNVIIPIIEKMSEQYQPPNLDEGFDNMYEGVI
jgi:predicted kinase